MDITMSALQVLLLAIMFLAILVEVKTGGTGAGIIFGLVAAGVFWGSQYVKGAADLFQIGLFLGGALGGWLAQHLGPGTLVAREVNGFEGLWVGFTINGDRNWMLVDQSRFTPASGQTWLIWLITAALLSLIGAAAIARLINRPLKQLSYAANRVREGDFDASQLDEEAVTSEIREVNIGFNRMAQKLAKL